MSDQTAGIPKITITWRGTPYVLDPRRIDAGDTRLVRATTGESLRYWLGLQEDADLDQVAVVLWLARRHAGEKDPGSNDPISLKVVESALSYATFEEEIQIQIGDTVEEEIEDPTDSSSDGSSSM